MQQKKNPKNDIRRWSLVIFQAGLILVLFLAWRTIEMRTYDKKDTVETRVIDLSDLEPEDVQVVEQPKTDVPPPPPPPKVVDKIEIVEDDDIEDDEIETVEDVEDDKVQVTADEVADIGDIQSVPEGNDEPIETVPFRAVQDVPVFPGCEQYTNNTDRRNCMEDKVKKFINKRFNTDLGRQLGMSGLTRINVQFTVDEHGNITNVKARATEPKLEQEAIRVVKMLPKMTPGKQRGKAVRVPYTLPIMFQVN